MGGSAGMDACVTQGISIEIQDRSELQPLGDGEKMSKGGLLVLGRTLPR